MGIGDDIWGDTEQPGQQYDYIPNPYLEQNTNDNKKKYTTLLITAIITVALLVSGGIFAIIWAITDSDDGILFRKTPKDIEQIYVTKDDGQVVEKTTGQAVFTDRDVNQYLISLEEYIPIDVRIRGIEFNAGEYEDETILTLEITNNSQFDELEVNVSEDNISGDSVYMYIYYPKNTYSVYLDSGETKVVQYNIYGYSSDYSGDMDIKARGCIDVCLRTYLNGEVDWDTGTYHFLEVEGGKICWNDDGVIYDVKPMNTWGYCSTSEIQEGYPVKYSN